MRIAQSALMTKCKKRLLEGGKITNKGPNLTQLLKYNHRINLAQLILGLKDSAHRFRLSKQQLRNKCLLKLEFNNRKKTSG